MDCRAQRTEHKAAVPPDGGFAVGVVLRGGTGDGREFEIDAVDRRAIYTDAVLRNPEDGLVARRARIRGQCETGTPADAGDGAGSDICKATTVGSRVIGHRIYPYRLRSLKIDRPRLGQRLPQGFVYLVAIMDWFSRYVLAWEVSISLESAFAWRPWTGH